MIGAPRGTEKQDIFSLLAMAFQATAAHLEKLSVG